MVRLYPAVNWHEWCSVSERMGKVVFTWNAPEALYLTAILAVAMSKCNRTTM